MNVVNAEQVELLVKGTKKRERLVSWFERIVAEKVEGEMCRTKKVTGRDTCSEHERTCWEAKCQPVGGD